MRMGLPSMEMRPWAHGALCSPAERFNRMRVATWNLKQAVAPKKPLPELWDWLGDRVDPTVAVLTEAKVPSGGPPAGWSVEYEPDGIGPRRKWGTVIAARGVSLQRVTSVKRGLRTVPLTFRWPAAVIVSDVIVGKECWGTVVGLYGLTVDRRGESCGHGGFSVPTILNELEPLLESKRAERLLIAGDFNLWPSDASGEVVSRGLVDLIEHTAATRPALVGCSGCAKGPNCGHLWTHKNGNSPNAAKQQIDYVFASRRLVEELRSVYGGVQYFHEAWDVSDHAPVVAEFA